MNEQELRQLVRTVLAERDGRLNAATIPKVPVPQCRDHASHVQFVIEPQGEACIIEPAVTCNHCGYCRSYGH